MIFRFFRQFLLLSAVHFTSLSLFRFFAAVFQTMVAAMSAGSSFMLFVFIFSGFIIPRRKNTKKLLDIYINSHILVCLYGCQLCTASMPAWLKWGFWLSPLSYGEIGVSVNEFLAPRWQKVSILFSFRQKSRRTRTARSSNIIY